MVFDPSSRSRLINVPLVMDPRSMEVSRILYRRSSVILKEGIQ